MGFHVCEYCSNETSSGDVTIHFSSGRSWVMPDMITHYIRDHYWLPPAELIDDVMKATVLAADREQTKSAPTPVGYITGPFTPGVVPAQFVTKLSTAMVQGSRRQTRGG